MENGNVIGPGIRVRGRISGSGGLTVDGVLEGPVELDGNLLVGPGGRITGDVAAEDVRVQGDVTGDIIAARSATIGSGAAFEGCITASHVVIHPRARFKGRLDMPLDLPSTIGRGRTAASGW